MTERIDPGPLKAAAQELIAVWALETDDFPRERKAWTTFEEMVDATTILALAEEVETLRIEIDLLSQACPNCGYVRSWLVPQ